MFNTFNMGVGMSMAVASRRTRTRRWRLLREQRRARPYILGEIVAGEGGRGAMVKIAVLVSGGGTNLQAILDAERRRAKLPHRHSSSLVVASRPSGLCPGAGRKGRAFPRRCCASARNSPTEQPMRRGCWSCWTATDRVWWCWRASSPFWATSVIAALLQAASSNVHPSPDSLLLRGRAFTA